MVGCGISWDRRCRISIFLIHLGAAMVATEPRSDLPDAQPDNGDIVGGGDAGRSCNACIDHWARVRHVRNLRCQRRDGDEGAPITGESPVTAQVAMTPTEVS